MTDHENLTDLATAQVLGNMDNITDALGDIGAFSGKNPRFVGNVKHEDCWTTDDCKDAEGEFNNSAPSGAIFYGLIFGDERTSRRCKYEIAQRIERALKSEIEKRADEIGRQMANEAIEQAACAKFDASREAV